MKAWSWSRCTAPLAPRIASDARWRSADVKPRRSCGPCVAWRRCPKGECCGREGASMPGLAVVADCAVCRRSAGASCGVTRPRSGPGCRVRFCRHGRGWSGFPLLWTAIRGGRRRFSFALDRNIPSKRARSASPGDIGAARRRRLVHFVPRCPPPIDPVPKTPLRCSHRDGGLRPIRCPNSSESVSRLALSAAARAHPRGARAPAGLAMASATLWMGDAVAQIFASHPGRRGDDVRAGCRSAPRRPFGRDHKQKEAPIVSAVLLERLSHDPCIGGSQHEPPSSANAAHPSCAL